LKSAVRKIMRSDARTSCLLTAAITFLFIPFIAFALPEGETVVSGSAAFDRSVSNTLNVNTPSERLIVNYNSFSIAQPETVSFQQPSASAIVLNRVVGVDPSAIMGTLNANGRVFIVNPNGVIFGPNSRVDVAGLVASSLNISNDDFLNGNFVFRNRANGYVINEGTINARGGYVCLLGGAVDNRMMIQAELGTVVLAAGEKITVSLEDQNAISVVVDEAVQSEVFGPDGEKMTSAVKNSGTILAEGGKVMLTAKVLNRVFDHAINNTGLVKVTSLVERDGVIELVAEGAPIVNSGTLEADRIDIKGSNADFVNTPEARIIANAVAAASPDGGKIAIEATSVLQQGLISANSLEQGTAGEIIIVSEGTATFDSSSCTEARAMGIVGNGGRINIASKQASVFVNKNAKIDFSAGSVSGNGGLLRIDAFEQLGFYGILNGRAPPGYTPGKAILDPDYATIGNPETTLFIDADTTVDAWLDITINGNIRLGYNTTLNLFADHQVFTEGNDYFWYEWDTISPGIGAIINGGDFIIYGDDNGGTLNLRAGSGIGTIDRMIQTNVQYLSAVINPDSYEGDIFIDQGDARLYIGAGAGEERRGIYSPGLVVLTSLGIIQSNSPSEPTITADDLFLESEGGIVGYQGAFTTSVHNLAVVNYDSGSIDIVNDRNLVVLAAVNYAVPPPTGGPGAGINISTTSGDITVRYGISGNGPITLNADNNIILSTLANIGTTPASTVTLIANNGAILREDLESEYGLVAFWNFDNIYNKDDGDSFAEDVSGNGNDARIYGNPAITTGYFGDAAFSFDGVDDRLVVDGNLDLGDGSFTLICWYMGTQSLNNVGLMGASPYPYTSGYALETHYGALQYWVNNNMVRSAISVNDRAWHQLAMVRDGSEGRLSIFGQDTTYMVDFPVLEDSVNTSADLWIGGWGHMRRLAQGALNDVRVYDRALSDFELYGQTLIGSGQGRINAGNVVLEAASGIDVELGLSSTVNAASEAGEIAIEGYGDLILVPNDSGWAVFGGGDDDIMISSRGNITVQGQVTTSGDVRLDAYGSLTVSDDMNADDLYLWADSNWDGIGALTINASAGDRVFYCNSFNVAGANIFDVTVDGDLSLDNGLTWFGVSTGLDSDIRGFSVLSTLEAPMTVYNSLEVTDFITFRSAGDLRIYTDLYAQQIYTFADDNGNGSGSLFSGEGTLSLFGKQHFLNSGSDFYIDIYEGNIIRVRSAPYSEGVDFYALLQDIDPGDGLGFGYLSVSSSRASGGDIYVNAPLDRTMTGNGISLMAGHNIYINAPITTTTGGIYLYAMSGSIFGALEYDGESFTHITTNVMINLEAGGIIGSYIIPISVDVQGESYYGVDLSVYGAEQEDLEGPLVSAVLSGITPSGSVTIGNYPPGQVIFNGAVVWDPSSYVPPIPDPDPDPGPDPDPDPDPDPYPDPDPDPDSDQDPDHDPISHNESLSDPIAPVGNIISNVPNPVDAGNLAVFQFNSPIGTVFAYHPITRADMGAVEPLSVGAGSYELLDGEIRLFGNEGLLQFFQEFDEKYKQL